MNNIANGMPSASSYQSLFISTQQNFSQACVFPFICRSFLVSGYPHSNSNIGAKIFDMNEIKNILQDKKVLVGATVGEVWRTHKKKNLVE